VLVAGSVGDSRAYWLPDDGAAVQLTVDDSWATEAIRQGTPRADAEADNRAHGITRWLGIDSPDATPACVATTTGGAPGWLLVCSDGLWNYRSEAGDVRALVAELSAGDTEPAEPAVLAGALVDWANAQGGADNISAIVARVPAATTVTRSKHG
jgi:serine/threonine protein phosphatase PrpC